MKHNSMRWFRAIVAVIAVVCLAFGSQTVTYVRSADTTEVVKLDEKLGVKPGAVLAELKAHENDGYYLGTPYDSTPLSAENCMRPNGEYGGAGGMNCTGFVAYVLEKCGADLSGIASRGYLGGKVNASNWYHWLTENSVEYYHYSTIEELLAGGLAQKGDVIYFEPISWESEDTDCHIGFFWGNDGGDSKFWHSALKPGSGNQISELVSKSPSTVYLFKIAHTGEVEVKKASANDELTQGNGCYSLAGAEYTLYYSGTSEVAAVITTDEKGYGKVSGIEEGSYDILETKAPKGYALDTQKKSVTVSAGETVVYSCKDNAKRNPVELLLGKVDAETGEPKPQGAAAFGGAEFTVRYYDVISENNPAESGRNPVRTWTFRTDESGAVRFSEEYKISGDELYLLDGEEILPLGTVTIQETKAPEGYCLQEQIYVKCIREEEENESEILHTWQQTEIEEKVKRGDLELIKAADGTLERLSGIPFRITSKTTGEAHVIVTDKNGYASTSSGWNPHTQNTNGGEKSEDGIWFGEGVPDDSKGALIYDTYLVEELQCDNNRDRILIPAFEVVITRDNYMVNLGTLTNDAYPLPEIATTARDRDTGGHQAAAKENSVIIDTVSYRNLAVGKEYSLKGTLMDAGTGEVLLVNGKEVTAEKNLTAETEEGNVEVEFSFDASELEGRTVVVFEEMFCGEETVAVHADLNDAGQTVSYERKMPENPGTKASEVQSVRTGDDANLIVLILCAFLSCVIIGKCAIMRARNARNTHFKH